MSYVNASADVSGDVVVDLKQHDRNVEGLKTKCLIAKPYLFVIVYRFVPHRDNVDFAGRDLREQVLLPLRLFSAKTL